ncbi:MAG: glycosyltransferase [Candidatus Magasanikbacteria bacterium CG10_big_fil_rev_8_21_14_0_10_42_10]|uniref:Glycosyltransferase n=2 Tax=Candidatus Magasanikiibacteriota TaxID=1752731 RepID=A0A2H0TW63_9BACT|nr:MAG: glycosyltransferase [Candidatus Magasanikbacteria bacterium CG10_big_fil_rev_8_21_14_0_10_42_10]PIZ93011.1 MAG: glycosyltransferase [Candidatus Magasanikbacteria bacterium CG_4_10_14_0_2_um_filter_41_10]
MQKMLGVRIDPYTKKEVLEKAKAWLSGNTTHSLYTPNPEMLVEAHKYPVFKEILNRGDMNVCDGAGIALMSGGAYARFPGADLMLALCELAESQGSSIYLLGGGNRVAKNAKIFLKSKFPSLSIKGVHAGPRVERRTSGQAPLCKVISDDHEKLLAEIAMAKPDILFVAFGHVKQEWWIDTFMSELPGVKIVMGVGGSFDFLAGTVSRAPKLFRIIGIEWLWRLIQQPRRFKRIFTAIFIFPFLVLKSYVIK